MEAHVNLIITDMEINDNLLSKIKEKTEKDPDLIELKRVILQRWPNNNKQIKNNIKIYTKYKDDLTTINGIICKGQTILVPNALRKEMLIKLHYKHLGLNKGIALANSCVFWPTIKNELKQIIENCPTC